MVLKRNFCAIISMLTLIIASFVLCMLRMTLKICIVTSQRGRFLLVNRLVSVYRLKCAYDRWRYKSVGRFFLDHADTPQTHFTNIMRTSL
jgi:hypothetical protein